MAKLTLRQIYHGDKYNIMGEVIKDFMENGSPDVQENTGLELLIVKHTIKATEKMRKNGDYLSEMMVEE